MPHGSGFWANQGSSALERINAIWDSGTYDESTDTWSGSSGTHVTNHCFYGGTAFSTALTALGNSWWSFEPDDYGGGTFEWRVVLIYEGATAADVIGVELYDTRAAAAIIAEATEAAPDNGPNRVHSAWVAAPTTAKGGYVRARNQTGARGQAKQAWIEIRGV